MLVTITLPTSVADAAAHAGMIAIGGVVQAALIVLFPVRRWGAQRDALADALAAEADYAPACATTRSPPSTRCP